MARRGCAAEVAVFGEGHEVFELTERREDDGHLIHLSRFAARDAVVLGASIDSEFVHLAWRQSREDLGRVRYPWLADIKRELASALGVLDRSAGVAMRATFLVDPEGVIRHVSVHDLDVGRNPRETLRVLDALQTGGLCPVNWEKGQETLSVG